jgi:hypothetical protein
MKPFERHSLVLVPFPFTDRATQKRRPVAMGSQPSCTNWWTENDADDCG